MSRLVVRKPALSHRILSHRFGGVALLGTALALLTISPIIADPPARVVRLNLTDGAVSFRPAGMDQWTGATINRPLVNGDEIWTEASSRAEMHIGGSAAVRLGSATSFAIVNETDSMAQLRLAQGTLNVRVRGVGDRDVWEIDTPNASVSLLKPGRYRVEVTADGLTTMVTARGGEAEVTAGASAFPVHAGERGAIAGTADQSHEISAAPAFDDFDRWCRDRDQREDKLAAGGHVPRGVVGYEDLDASGTWRNVPGYGWAWTPTVVVAGWAPYHYGHWAWVEPWGWTWIDDAPWGFAPFHYGRWAFAGGAWLWVPGTIVRPVYAPALVAFAGGAGWRASFAVGTVGWWPLAPGEVFVPAYAVAPVYVRNINASVVNVTQVNVTNVNVTQVKYANQTVAGAVTAVPQQSFASAQPVATSAVALSNTQAASAAPIGTTAPVAPAAQSVLGHSSATSSSVAQPPPSVASRSVVSKTPPPPTPIPFAAKQQALAANPGRPLDHAADQRLRGTAATTGVARAATNQNKPGKAPPKTKTVTKSNPRPKPKVPKHPKE
ncbi:MAG TPA: DUF6600 domain-containing protein [Thermoanaerobaculia bacterium]|nr:DUF6600 domain-containing protein [Thermoanaerobaculia bacterium]